MQVSIKTKLTLLKILTGAFIAFSAWMLFCMYGCAMPDAGKKATIVIPKVEYSE